MPSSFAGSKANVFVSILPQKYFVEKIGGNLVDVSVMVAPGASPSTYEPRPSQMVALSRASLYFAIGVPFEKSWLHKISGSNPRMKIIYTEEGIEKIPMKVHTRHVKGQYVKDSHVEDRHDHPILDPHIWLSPNLVKIQAKNILDGLCSFDRNNQKNYETNYKNFIKQINNLDSEIQKIFSDMQERKFVVFHPSWGYFAKEYRLIQIPVEVEGKEPKISELRHLTEFVRNNQIKTIFVQPQFSEKSAKVIAKAISGKTVYLDPLARLWAENLIEVAKKIRTASVH